VAKARAKTKRPARKAPAVAKVAAKTADAGATGAADGCYVRRRVNGKIRVQRVP